MSFNPFPYIEGAQSAGKNYAENRSMDDILKQSRMAENSQGQDDIMAQVLQRLPPEKRPEAMQYIQNKKAQQQSQEMKVKQAQALQTQGFDASIANLDPAIQKEIIKAKTQKAATNPSGTLSAIDELEKLAGQTGIGLSGQINPSQDARFNRGRFQSLQAKLLPLFKGMFPRGMTEKEFKFIQANYIPQVGDTEAKIKGKLQGLRELAQEQGGVSMPQSQQQAVEMKDAQGNIYDIPADLVEKARAQGFQ